MKDVMLSSSVRGASWTRRVSSFEEIHEYLMDLLTYPGCVSISAVDSPDIGAEFLEVRAEDGKYLISMTYNTSFEDEETRFYVGGKRLGDSEFTEILGDKWDSSLVCVDFKELVDVFEEFFREGDVSKSILR